MLSKLTETHWRIHAEWLVLCILFPFVVTISPSQSYVLALLFLPFLLRFWRGDPILPQTPYNALLISLLIMVVISLSITYSIPFSLRKASTLIWGIFLFWGLQSSLNQKLQNKYWLLAFICLLGLATSFIALFNPVISLGLPAGSLIFATLSTIPGANELAKINPNEIGGILAWCIPVSFSFAVAFFQKKSPLKFDYNIQQSLLAALFILPLLPMMIVLFLASSRSALGGVILASGLIIWLMNENGRSKIILSGIGIFALSLLVILFLDESSGLQPILVDLVEPLIGESDNQVRGITTLSVRAEIWSRALDGIGDFPITGMGMNTFREVVHTVYPLFLVPQDLDIAHAHNQFLQVALDLGIPGLIFYSGILILAFLCLATCWNSGQHDGNYRMAVAGVSGALLASLVFGLTDAIALGAVPSFIFWLLLAVAAALDNEKTTHTQA